MKTSLLASTALGLSLLGGAAWLRPARILPAVALVQPAPTLAPAEASLDSTLLVTTGLVGAGGVDLLPARTAGYVRNIFFASGDYARCGQLLVKLENHTFVTAPRAGFLGPCQLRIGQHLTAKSAVTTLSKRSYLVVSALLPANWPARIHPGDSVRVWAQHPAGRVAFGVVGALGPPGPGDSPVEINLASRAPFRIGEQVYIRLRDTSPELAAR